jgi:hypothetical protein
MKNILTIVFCFFSISLFAQEEGRKVISLNGEWEFDQTKTAFPPAKFTRKIPVPGLIHLAAPRIEQYDKFFQRPVKDAVMESDHNFIEGMIIRRCTIGTGEKYESIKILMTNSYF